MATTKSLKIRFSGYKFVSDGTTPTGANPYAGTWESKIYTKTFSIAEAKVNTDIPASGEMSQTIYDNCYNAAKAMLFDGVVDFGDITPVLVESNTVKGVGIAFADAINHPTNIEIYWETIEDVPITVA